MAPSASRLRQLAFTLVEVMVVVLIIGILTAIVIPVFVNARETSRSKACIQNLKEIEAAKVQYLMDNRLQNTYDFNADSNGGFNDLYPKYVKILPTCPSNGAYTVNSGNSDATCSYAATNPAHSLP